MIKSGIFQQFSANKEPTSRVVFSFQDQANLILYSKQEKKNKK